jgi:hypothetical protein
MFKLQVCLDEELTDESVWLTMGDVTTDNPAAKVVQLAMQFESTFVDIKFFRLVEIIRPATYTTQARGV